MENGGRFPTTLIELVTQEATGTTLGKDPHSGPLDPWGNAYLYEPPTATRGFRVFSLGSGGVPGGVGDAADIDNLTVQQR